MEHNDYMYMCMYMCEAVAESVVFLFRLSLTCLVVPAIRLVCLAVNLLVFLLQWTVCSTLLGRRDMALSRLSRPCWSGL